MTPQPCPALADGFDGSGICVGPNHSTIELWYDTGEQAIAARRAILSLIDAALASQAPAEQPQDSFHLSGVSGEAATARPTLEESFHLLADAHMERFGMRNSQLRNAIWGAFDSTVREAPRIIDEERAKFFAGMGADNASPRSDEKESCVPAVSALPQGWQPIETAPKDGAAVLVMLDIWPGTDTGRAEECNGHNTYVAEWWAGERSGAGAWVCYMDAVHDPECPIEPTHWMPLPPPPVDQGEQHG